MLSAVPLFPADVVNLLESDSDSDADLLISPFKRPRQRPVAGSSHEGAGPSRAGRRLEWQEPAQQLEQLTQRAQQPVAQHARQQQQQQQPSPALQQAAQQLAELCQVSPDDAVAALQVCGGDLEAAADFIFESQQLQQPQAAERQPPAPPLQQQQQQQQPAQLRAPHQEAAAAAAAARGAQAPEQAGAVAAHHPGTGWQLRERLALPPLAPGQAFSDTYDTVLLVDSREQQATLQALKAALAQQGMAVESRCLPVGDMVWVARDRCVATDGTVVLRMPRCCTSCMAHALPPCAHMLSLLALLLCLACPPLPHLACPPPTHSGHLAITGMVWSMCCRLCWRERPARTCWPVSRTGGTCSRSGACCTAGYPTAFTWWRPRAMAA